MSFRTTILTAVAAVAMSAVSAAAVTLNFGTDVTGNVGSDGVLDLQFNTPFELVNDDFVIDQAFNLQSWTGIRIDPVVGGTGSLTLSTFVNPFAGAGIGSAQALLFTGGAGAGTVSATWGASAPVSVTANAAAVEISTAFSTSGMAGAQDLVISWSGVNPNQQVSVNIAAVPLPAGLLLMTTALGGLGLARRRKNKKADA